MIRCCIPATVRPLWCTFDKARRFEVVAATSIWAERALALKRCLRFQLHLLPIPSQTLSLFRRHVRQQEDESCLKPHFDRRARIGARPDTLQEVANVLRRGVTE